MCDAKLFWNNVNALIKAKNTTQEWLCKKCNLNLGTFKNRISAGRYPDALEAVLIASALGVTVEYLVTGQQPVDRTQELKSDILETLNKF